MITLDVEQGSAEWHIARSTMPTASKFGDIYTKTGKKSSKAEAYMRELLANWVIGHPPAGEGFSNQWTDRGTELEPQAIALMEMRLDVEIARPGFCLLDDKSAGCSPDGLIGADGGIEIKCPKAATHIEYLLRYEPPTKYVPQIQGCMYVTGRQYWYFVSYHPDMEPLVIRVERDDVYIAGLQTQLLAFNETMRVKKGQLIELGVKRAA